MAVKRHVRGVGSKEQRQYEHIKKSAQRSGRYGKRAKEMAARTVMKQHKKKGHKKAGRRVQRQPRRFGQSPKAPVADEVMRRISWPACATIRLVTSAATIRHALNGVDTP